MGAKSKQQFNGFISGIAKVAKRDGIELDPDRIVTSSSEGYGEDRKVTYHAVELLNLYPL